MISNRLKKERSARTRGPKNAKVQCHASRPRLKVNLPEQLSHRQNMCICT